MISMGLVLIMWKVGPKFQRMRGDYKIYYGVLTNNGLGWDEEIQTVNCPKHVIIDYVNVIFTKWSCTFCYFVIFFDFLYISNCGLILIILLYFRGAREQRKYVGKDFQTLSCTRRCTQSVLQLVSWPLHQEATDHKIHTC